MGKEAAETSSAKRDVFVREFLVDFNATQAAIRAGYSPRSAHVTASRLLTDAKVSAAIKAATEARHQRLDITAERIDRELARVAFFDLRDLTDERGALLAVKDWPEDARRAVVSLETDPLGNPKVRTADKLRALELLCKRQGLLTEKHEHDVKKGSTLEQIMGAAALIAAERRKGGKR